ncbi:MAG TPA: hypothetical protein PKW35_08905 [Nannocystaceae bacterium]|nr:hypothetical protein [Nannocystaceae bacterium]
MLAIVTSRYVADAAQRLVPAGPPGSMDGPACRTWAIESVSFKVPKTKKSGQAWDVFDGPPDPSLLVTLPTNLRDRLQG